MRLIDKRSNTNLIRAEQVNLVVIVLGGGGRLRGGGLSYNSRSTSTSKELGGSIFVAREGGVLSFPGLDVFVPPSYVGVLGGGGGCTQSRVNTDIVLSGLVSESSGVRVSLRSIQIDKVAQKKKVIKGGDQSALEN